MLILTSLHLCRAYVSGPQHVPRARPADGLVHLPGHQGAGGHHHHREPAAEDRPGPGLAQQGKQYCLTMTHLRFIHV